MQWYLQFQVQWVCGQWARGRWVCGWEEAGDSDQAEFCVVGLVVWLGVVACGCGDKVLAHEVVTGHPSPQRRAEYGDRVARVQREHGAVGVVQPWAWWCRDDGDEATPLVVCLPVGPLMQTHGHGVVARGADDGCTCGTQVPHGTFGDAVGCWYDVVGDVLDVGRGGGEEEFVLEEGEEEWAQPEVVVLVEEGADGVGAQGSKGEGGWFAGQGVPGGYDGEGGGGRIVIIIIIFSILNAMTSVVKVFLGIVQKKHAQALRQASPMARH